MLTPDEIKKLMDECETTEAEAIEYADYRFGTPNQFNLQLLIDYSRVVAEKSIPIIAQAQLDKLTKMTPEKVREEIADILRKYRKHYQEEQDQLSALLQAQVEEGKKQEQKEIGEILVSIGYYDDTADFIGEIEGHREVERAEKERNNG